MNEAATASPRIPLRPLNAAEVLDGATRVIRRNPRATFAVSVPAAVLIAVVDALVTLATTGRSGATSWSLLIGLLSGAFVNTVVTGLLAPMVTADVLRQPRDARAALRQALRGGRGLLLLAWLGVVIAVAQTVGAVLAFVGGAWLWGIWAVAGPVLTVERVGVRAALRRSFALTRTQFWRAWGLRALAWLVTSVVGLLIRLPFSALAAAVGSISLTGSTAGGVTHEGLYVTVLAVGTVLSAAVTLPYAAVVQCVLYADLRMRVEGLDIVLGLPQAPAVAPVTPAGAW